DRPACPLGLGKQLVHALLGADVVGERDAAEAVALGGDARVLGELVPWVEREGGRATGEQEAGPVVVLLFHRPAELLAVEALLALEVSHPERDDAHVWVHHAGCRARTSSSIWSTTSSTSRPVVSIWIASPAGCMRAASDRKSTRL